MQFLITERFLSPRKSIFKSQIFSSVGQSYCVMIVVSHSFAYCTGEYFMTGSGAMMIPHACTHNCLMFPSSFSESSAALFTFSSDS